MLTFSDVLEHLQDYTGGASDTKGQSLLRRSILRSYKDISQHSKGWRYYTRMFRVRQKAQVTTSTITYTASTRVLLLASGSWPAWAPYGLVRIAGFTYEIDSISGATATLSANNCPLSNIAAGTSYALYQTEYPLPSDFQDIIIPTGGSTNWLQAYVEPSQWFGLQKISDATGAPYYWTILGNTNINTYGAKCLCVYPRPTTDEDYEFLGRRKARRLRFSGYDAAEYAGTISISSTTVTGSGTSFNANMVGSILRVTDSTTTTPTGEGGLNPFTEEFVITAYSSATSITINSAPVGTYTAVKYRVTDPIDVDSVMEDALICGAEYQMECVANKSDASIQRVTARYNAALIQAFERDNQLPVGRAGVPFNQDTDVAHPVTGGLNFTADASF